MEFWKSEEEMDAFKAEVEGNIVGAITSVTKELKITMGLCSKADVKWADESQWRKEKDMRRMNTITCTDAEQSQWPRGLTKRDGNRAMCLSYA